MLHILWLIIKFILIVLGIALGLVLLALLLILFCPVRYRASAAKRREDGIKEIQAEAGVSWLFHAIALQVRYCNGNLEKSIKILGIPLEKLLAFLKRKKKGAPKKKAGIPAKAPVEENAEVIPAEEEPETEELEKAIRQLEETNPAQEEKEPGLAELENAVKQLEKGNPVPAEEEQESTQKPPESDQESSFLRLIRAILEKLKNIILIPVRFVRKMASLPAKLIGKVRKMALTLRRMYAKIDWWKQFLNHPRTKEAISLIWRDAKGLIHHVLPTRAKGNITFGCEDPSATGTILAVLGVTIPFHKNCIAVTPLFDGENLLEGTVSLKGRIYGWIFVKTAIEIYFNKNVKFVINRWKHKEG